MTIHQDQAEMLETAPPLARGLLERAYRKTASPRAAIKAMCLSCCHFDRAEIAGCTVNRCPLHAYRPYQERAR